MANTYLATLLTDFGSSDPYVGAMKGAMLRACPHARIMDITHDIPPHDVLAAANVLADAAPHFPPETLHVVVVDPGVGTERNILAARYGEQLFLFPDNGVITFVNEHLPLREIAVVSDTRYVPARASATFHGRDVFAPLAGHILNGLEIGALGPPPNTLKLLEIPEAGRDDSGFVGQVIYVDHFGNLVTNIPGRAAQERWEEMSLTRVLCAGRDIGPLRRTYADVADGQPVALVNSAGMVEVAVNRGRAGDVLSAGVGTEVRVTGPS